MKVSVIIPTYRRPEILERVFNSLCYQKGVEYEEYEIIIIGDGLDEPASLPFIENNTSPVNIKYFRQENSGPASARNFGVKQSQFSILLFLGDDMIASPFLLQEHIKFHSDHVKEACLGKIEHSKENQKATNLELFSMSGAQFKFPLQDGEVDFWHFYTGNISLMREDFLSLGGFMESFPGAGWEDIEFGYRFNKRSKIMYLSSAVVVHHHPLTFVSFIERQRRLGCDVHYLLEYHPELDSYFKIKDYPFHRMLKRLLVSNLIKKAILFLYSFINRLEYSQFVYYYLRILRYQYFYTGYHENLKGENPK